MLSAGDYQDDDLMGKMDQLDQKVLMQVEDLFIVINYLMLSVSF
jgi:hypothetical protein